MEIKLAGIFLTSENPAKTADFYRRVARLDVRPVREGFSDAYVAMDCAPPLTIREAKAFAPYAHPVNAESNLSHMYFKISDQLEFLDHIKEQAVKAFLFDDIVVTLIDPDGRKVLFGTV